MRHSHLPLLPSDSSGSGWVGVADSLVGGLILFLILAMAASSQLNKAKNLLSAKEKETKSLQEKLADLDAQIEKMKGIAEWLNDADASIDDLLQEMRALYVLLASVNQELSKAESDLASQAAEAAILRHNIAELKLRETELLERKRVLDAILLAFASTDEKIVAKLKELKSELEAAKVVKDQTVRIEKSAYQVLLENTMELAKLQMASKDRSDSAAVHAELLSLQGGLEKVVILLDFSHSMGNERGKQEGRWGKAKKYILNVCKHLDMNECVLIVFSNDIKVFGRTETKPEGPDTVSEELKRAWSTYTTRRELTATEKKALLQLGQLTEKDVASIKEIKPFKLRQDQNDRKLLTSLVDNFPNPKGGTNTLKALNAALQIEGVTNIILFTDGEPGLIAERVTVGERQKSEVSGARIKPPDCLFQMEWIFALVDKQKAEFKEAGKEFPKINAIGVGDYFDKDLATFLRVLSEEKTGGSFQGR